MGGFWVWIQNTPIGGAIRTFLGAISALARTLSDLYEWQSHWEASDWSSFSIELFQSGLEVLIDGVSVVEAAVGAALLTSFPAIFPTATGAALVIAALVQLAAYDSMVNSTTSLELEDIGNEG